MTRSNTKEPMCAPRNISKRPTVGDSTSQNVPWGSMTRLVMITRSDMSGDSLFRLACGIRHNPYQDTLIKFRIGISHALGKPPAYAATAVADPGDCRVRHAEARGHAYRPSVLAHVCVPLGSGCHGSLCVMRSDEVCITRNDYAREVGRLDLNL